MSKYVKNTDFIFLLISNNVYGEQLDSIITYGDHFGFALEHYESDRFKLAESEFKKILIDRKSFSDPVAHLMVAKSQYFQNKLIECQRTCNSFLNKYPKSKYDVDVRILLRIFLLSRNNMLMQLSSYY